MAAQEGSGPAPWQRIEDEGGGSISRAEMDELFGAKSAVGTPTAMERILSAGLVLYERLPMLDVVLDRLTRLATATVRNMLAVKTEVSIETVSTARFGQLLDAVQHPAILGVFLAEEWDNHGLVVVEPALVSAFVDVSLGGRSSAPLQIEGRSFTPIERALVARLIERLLDDLATSFLPLCGVHFHLERLETNPRAASIASVSSAAVDVRLRIEAGDRVGQMQLILPHATLEPVRELLIQQFMGEKFGRDSIWENHLREELWATEIELDAILDERTLRLSEVVSLRVGDRLDLDVTASEPVTLRCANARVFTGRLGRKNGKIAVRLEDRAN